MAQSVQISLRVGKKLYPDVAVGLKAFIDEFRLSTQGSVKLGKGLLRDYLDSVAQELAQRHSGSQTTDDSLARRTGRTVQSIIRSVQVKGRNWDTLTGSIGGTATLAIHEYGGTIKSKSGKLLTVPLPAAKSSSGAPPFARQWKNTFVATSKAGNLIIFQKRGTEIVPLYLLLESVEIKPRLGMRDEMQRQLPYFKERLLDRIADDIRRNMQ